MIIFVKFTPNSGHLSITDKYFKTRRCPLFRGFTVYCLTLCSDQKWFYFQINDGYWKRQFYAKILHYNFTTTIYKKTLNLFLYLSSKICMPVWFVQLNESKQFRDAFIGKCFNKWILSEKYKIKFPGKTAVCEAITFIWLSNYSKNVILNSCTFSIFPALEIKKLVGKILQRFDIISHIWIIHLLFH